MKQRPEFAWFLERLRAQTAASDLLPETYAAYRELLAEALYFFLAGLSSTRLQPLVAEQLAMPASTSTEARVATLLRHSPALHKLGQVVARDRRLAPTLRQRLQRLESLEPRAPRFKIRKLLDDELPGWHRAGIELDPEPLAEGSVAVVTGFRWQRRPTAHGELGVFKVLKPGIERALEEDLARLRELGGFLEESRVRHRLPAFDYQDTFDTISQLLSHESRLEEEQAHLAEAARLYRGSDSVVIPRLFPFCSRRITAMERIAGCKVTAGVHGDVGGRTLAHRIGKALIADPVFSAEPAALFHADPHAGNLFVTPAGRLAILDWSLAGRLSREARTHLAQLILGALILDQQRLETALAGLSSGRWRHPDAANILAASLRSLRPRVIPGLTWLTGLLDQLATHAAVRFQPDLLLFRKSLLTLEGVLADVLALQDPKANALLDLALYTGFLAHSLAEWPRRLTATPNARSPTTHLSGRDWLRLAWSGPVTLSRWWTAQVLAFAQQNHSMAGAR